MEFISEYQLTTEPLMIDTLIIKKPPEVVIEKNIGRIFRGHNIIEYKSPEDNMTLNEYYKAFSYLYLYSSLNHVSTTDTTLTLAVSNHPRDLLKYLRNDAGIKVEKSLDGIYYITGERVAVQIIELKSLSEEENLWLKSLRRKLDTETLTRLLNSSGRYGSDISAYIFAVAEANVKVLKGVDFVEQLAEIFAESPNLMRGFKKLGIGNLEEAKEEAKKEAKKEIDCKYVKRMLQDGMPYEKISALLLLPIEKIAEIDKSTNTK